MPRSKHKRRQSGGRRQIETALPKKQYKRTNRLLYVFSGILLVDFGGGAALLGAGSPRGAVTPPPTLSVPAPDASQSPVVAPTSQAPPSATTPTPIPATATPNP
jgi:hypothetical protein